MRPAADGRGRHRDPIPVVVREAVLLLDPDRVLRHANDEARRLLDLPADCEGRPLDAFDLPPALTALLHGSEEFTDARAVVHDRVLGVDLHPTDRSGGPSHLIATLRDTAPLNGPDTARLRLELLYRAGASIGTTLDITRTCQELAAALVPAFADFACVDLYEGVLAGGEPRPGQSRPLHRAALAGIGELPPLLAPGSPVPLVPGTPRARAVAGLRSVVEPDLSSALAAWDEIHPSTVAAMRDQGVHTLVTVPLAVGGTLLGVATFWRARPRPAFDEEDRTLAEELTARAAVLVENARRYTREHTMAVALQHSLLPAGLPEQHALEVASRYLPAQAGVGGDWFDVIPLSGARVALVVGDVVGHGVHAAATMGRLRTAVHTFSSLDLAPDELLGHLDALVNRLDQEHPAPDGSERPITGATCLYAVYDPVARRCTLARAGHPPPAVAYPDGRVEIVDLPAGPPLGLTGMPYESVELELPEGSRLVLYTDGLVESRSHDLDHGLKLLRAALAHPGRDPRQTCEDVLAALLPVNPADDTALLVARTRALPADHVADWEVPADPAAVARVRAAVTRRLADWGLADQAFAAELVLSELITNAIRYAAPPIRVRLLRDRALICEVRDGSATSPHLRYATDTDEGGRGLFLVAQLAERWGTRYPASGKVIWAELPLAE
ncbi:serine phosphatase RsbU (regulator of sigma subunit) [Kitasatospora sp. SolWspMP-SS2h]|uniref:SpoIIE family protein phosphatase n=1 Tax=Kitasatospora sp. SolWspMP-SS2h TaxID=1305729 RepID=UPI000DB9B9B4|nr:SpoIIE family protein phosphatase [Kitasatospora sp. SolWspMP-SS2h]RAJ33170.1 serine phosphatase RsbU (regulator of sigma subunit) [Kitasatospora sp. SolWspMP-SS2h]